MIKVMWFLKRADHLSLDEFRQWWISEHAPEILDDQEPYLKGYKIDIRVDDDSKYLGKTDEDFNWDGIAEQYFDTIEDYNAVYGRKDRKTRSDTLSYTKEFQRFVVSEHVIK